MTSVCLIVLNYNGVDHLQECLSTAEGAVRRFGRPCPIVLLDNRSTDDGVAIARRAFPAIEIVVAPTNDCLFSLNDVVARRPEDVVVIVNNDMRFDGEFIGPLVSRLDDPDVFASAAAILTWDGSRDTVGPRCARLERCWFHKWWSYERQQPSLTLEACGGAAAYRRRAFVALGGFDPLYRPGYYEDLDLSYRAWSAGWKIVYEPRSKAFHKESAAMLPRYGDAGKAQLLYRNHLLFTIKNIGGPAFLAGFFLLLPYRVLGPLLQGYRVPLIGFLRALPRIPLALARRLRAQAGQLDLSPFERVTPLA